MNSVGTAVSIRNVSRWFDQPTGRKTVMAGFNWLVAEHSFTVLMAPSGAGKTVLLRLIAGLDQPDSGTVLRTKSAERVGMIFQGGINLPWLSVAQNISFTSTVNGKTMSASEAADIADEVGLKDVLHAYPHQLSGGMNQRLAIARCLASNVNLILLDEPLSALDLKAKHSLVQLLSSVWRRRNLTAVLVTHNPSDAAYLGTRIVICGNSPIRILETLDLDSSPEERTAKQCAEVSAHIQSRVFDLDGSAPANKRQCE
jgi:NitT/TauT family transport system ATP-binding protein